MYFRRIGIALTAFVLLTSAGCRLPDTPWLTGKAAPYYGVILIIGVGVPLTVRAFVRHGKRKRLNAAYAEAETHMVSKRAFDAINVLEACRKDLFNTETLNKWADLAMAAFNQAGDIESLCKLYDRLPGKFIHDEAPALTVARAEVQAARWDGYAALREAWRGREKTPGQWLALDSDVLVAQEEEEDALALLDSKAFEGPEEAGRLARLALLKLAADPVEANQLAARATALAPKDAEIHSMHAALLEDQGRFQEALAAYNTAVACAPRDFFVHDRMAEFYRRAGDFDSALRIWMALLGPPSMDFIWLKVLFWTRVAAPHAVQWEQLRLPRGHLDSLVNFVLQLPDGQFWDAQAFSLIADYEPDLLSRQEVFWLRVLESIRTGAEEEALTLLNLQGFGARSWHPDLELALLRILLYRRTKYLGSNMTTHETGPRHGNRHPLFIKLDKWTAREDGTLSEPAVQFLESPWAYAAACYAAGWKEAANHLTNNQPLPHELLNWLRTVA
jgi:hypothetical protein